MFRVASNPHVRVLATWLRVVTVAGGAVELPVSGPRAHGRRRFGHSTTTSAANTGPCTSPGAGASASASTSAGTGAGTGTEASSARTGG